MQAQDQARSSYSQAAGYSHEQLLGNGSVVATPHCCECSELNRLQCGCGGRVSGDRTGPRQATMTTSSVYVALNITTLGEAERIRMSRGRSACISAVSFYVSSSGHGPVQWQANGYKGRLFCTTRAPNSTQPTQSLFANFLKSFTKSTYQHEVHHVPLRSWPCQHGHGRYSPKRGRRQSPRE